VTIPMPNDVYIGLAVTAHNDGTLCTAEFDNVQISGQSISDTDPPVPNPMTWSVEPYAIGPNAISMTATTATDPSGVEYYFDCISVGCIDSGWQDSPTYVATGLTHNTAYGFKVKARDKSVNQNETELSFVKSATTEPLDTISPAAPTGLDATAISAAQINLVWNDNPDSDLASYNVYYQGSQIATGLTTSNYSDTGLLPDTHYCYTVTAVDTSGNESLPSVEVCTTTLGVQPWINSDIGNPGQTGSAFESGGIFTIEGGGRDIWETSDGFHFVYWQFSGDGEAVARVLSLEDTDNWAKAGVMIRETLNDASAHAMTVITVGNGVAFQRRVTTGGNSFHTSGGSASVPVWVRIVRSGDSFSSYSSANGVNWSQIGSPVTIPMPNDVYIGLAVTAHNDGTLCTAEFDNVQISGQ
jgi:Fibronectin type III domain